MSARGKRLKDSDNDREGYKLDVGGTWTVECGPTMRELDVFANANSIRVRDMSCGEWEMAERSAVYLSVTQARQLGEILTAAADVVERDASFWRHNSGQATPGPELDRLMHERLHQVDRELAAEKEDLRREVAAKRAANVAEQEADLVGVTLGSAGDRKIGVIKVLRDHIPGLGLREAKDIVDSAPRVVLDGVTREAAERAVASLTAAGATVAIVKRIALDEARD